MKRSFGIQESVDMLAFRGISTDFTPLTSQVAQSQLNLSDLDFHIEGEEKRDCMLSLKEAHLGDPA